MVVYFHSFPISKCNTISQCAYYIYQESGILKVGRRQLWFCLTADNGIYTGIAVKMKQLKTLYQSYGLEMHLK